MFLIKKYSLFLKHEIDEKKLLDSTLKGYIEGLDDEYSEYMTSEEWEDYQADALGNYVGIGIYMSMDKNNNVIVLTPIPGTPAEEAGIEAGDIFAEVNGENVASFAYDKKEGDFEQYKAVVDLKVNDKYARVYKKGTYSEVELIFGYDYDTLRFKKDASTTDRESAIMFGLPLKLVEGVLVGRKFEHDKLAIEHIKKLLPGRYICNLAYYTALHSGIPSLFIHIPLLLRPLL